VLSLALKCLLTVGCANRVCVFNLEIFEVLSSDLHSSGGTPVK